MLIVDHTISISKKTHTAKQNPWIMEKRRLVNELCYYSKKALTATQNKKNSLSKKTFIRALRNYFYERQLQQPKTKTLEKSRGWFESNNFPKGKLCLAHK